MNSSPLKILFCSSEVFPLIKTGGLADVSSGLPQAIDKQGHDIRIIVPAYKQIMDEYESKVIAEANVDNLKVNLRTMKLPDSNVTVLLADAPELYYRNGGPYSAPDGNDWPDNAERFSTFSKLVCLVALNKLGLSWAPDVVHCNDWQTGLVPAYLSLEHKRPSTVFTIHNMAYLGLFSHQKFNQLELPDHWWGWNILEFHHHFSFIKGGLVFADQINTVSPTYAEQIKTSEYGYGMEGLLNYRSHLLSGILNGVDYQQWNPETDKLIPYNYSINSLEDKAKNKLALQKQFELPQIADVMLIGVVGRMVEQKGYDLILQALPEIIKRPVQIVMLGSGDINLENDLLNSMENHPDQISITIGYDETISHLVEAGADLFMMPSRFEPCGLNQFYSLKYGTIPFVNDTGGLSDSVIDSTPENIKDGSATGFKFYDANLESFLSTFEHAYNTFNTPKTWREIMLNGMKKDFSWEKSANDYINLYHKSIKSQYHIPVNLSV